MAEFVETMRKIRELCKEREGCAGCIMMNDIACGVTTGTPCLSEEEIERRVAQWEADFWENVRKTYAEINGKSYKPMSRESLTKWYNALHTDSAEYKMWGNGIALPCATFVLEGIAETLMGGIKNNEDA